MWTLALNIVIIITSIGLVLFLLFQLAGHRRRQRWAKQAQSWKYPHRQPPAWIRPQASDGNSMRRAVALLYNPIGGTRHNRWLIEKVVVPMLTKALLCDDAMTLQTFETTKPNHAKQLLLSEITSNRFCLLVVLGGDGTFHDIINGVAERCNHNPSEMASEFRRMPLMLLPGGSSNGLVKSLGYATDDLFATLERALLLERMAEPIDLLQVNVLEQQQQQQPDIHHQRDNTTPYWEATHISAISIVCHDHLQEIQLRSSLLPVALRNLLAPLLTIGINPRATIRVSIRSHSSSSSSNLSTSIHECSTIMIANIPWVASDMFTAPRASMTDGLVDVVVLSSGSRLRLLQLFLALESGKHVDSPLVAYEQSDYVCYELVEPSDSRLQQHYHCTVTLGGSLVSATKLEVLCQRNILNVVY
jgi:diacylglycerol kinase family enzyme